MQDASTLALDELLMPLLLLGTVTSSCRTVPGTDPPGTLYPDQHHTTQPTQEATILALDEATAIVDRPLTLTLPKPILSCRSSQGLPDHCTGRNHPCPG